MAEEAQAGGVRDGDVVMGNGVGPSGEGAQQNLIRRREDTWQDLVNNAIPHRDLRYNQTNLPPVGLGNILDASMRMRLPVPPSDLESEANEDDDAPPLSRKEVWVKMEYHKNNQGKRTASGSIPDNDANDGMDDGNSVSQDEVLDICSALREDINSGFDRIIDKMDERRGSTTRTPTAPRKSRSGKKISTVAQRRNPLKNENAKIVREHLTALVREDTLYMPMVTEEESAAFETQWMESGRDRRELCCTAEAFRFDILGTPRNPWNTSAARVFYHSLIPEGERSNAKLRLITEAFHTRIKSLKGEYKRRRDATDHQARKHHDRRQARKHYLFQRRLEVALAIPQLNRHYAILEELTVAGMSSDESDSERISLDPARCRERPKYEVTAPAWRNPRLHNWLRVFDVLHTAKRRNKGPSAGEWPHNRFLHSVAPKPSSSSRFVSGLPIDAYNSRWLGTRYDIEWSIQPVDQEYNFTHSDEVYVYLNQANSTS